MTNLEGTKDILGGFEKQMSQLVKRSLKKKGVNIVTEAMAKGVDESKDGVTVTYEVDGKEETIEADYVLVTVGRVPNTENIGLEQDGFDKYDRDLIKFNEQCRITIAHIYDIGDIVTDPQLAHKATYEGKVAA